MDFLILPSNRFTCLCTTCLFLCFFALPCLSDPRATQVARICTNTTAAASDRQIFVANFVAAMDTMTQQISSRQFGSAHIGTGNNTAVYALGECMKDLSPSDCNLCFAQCKIQILRCFPFQLGTRGGRIFFDGCYLRYDEYNFFNESLSPVDSTVCGSNRFRGNTTVFGDNVVELGRHLSSETPSNDGFFVGSVTRGNEFVYGLAQCWNSVSRNGCVRCLNDSVSRINSCPPKSEGRVINAGCYLRYSPEKFYYNNTASATSGTSGRSTVLALTFSVIALVSVVVVVAIVARTKIKQKRRERRLLGRLTQTVNKSKLNFSYETLEKATNYFNQSNKLGQGGSGSVYQGILPDGKPVAVKRLVFNTMQWVEHFFNEVNLISDLHHKNLAKLLGCSITGPESLLVYEYVPNLSLHDHFRNKMNPLNWEIRSKIILGIAEGLAYLHEESTLRIIHRDIKLSNILLDEDFTPKIADFGLAHLFPEDKTHVTTAIAGTLGYMAPEYVVRGKLTEKADVYSYGVLVIEIVTGKRNNSFSGNSYSILQMVWDLYGREILHEAADPIFEGKFRQEELSRTLQIALLCVQASAELRPSMSTVVKILSDDNNEQIPSPTQPPFMKSGHFERPPPLTPIVYHIEPKSDNTQSSGNTMTQSLVLPR